MVVSGKKGVSIPIMLMHEGEGMVLTVETKHDCVYRGLVEYAEDCMNIRMRDVLLTQPTGETKHLKSVWIPGFSVRFVVFPDILEHSPMFRRVDMQSKGKKVSTGLGVLRQAGIRNKAGGAQEAGFGDRDFSITRSGPPGALSVQLGGGMPGPRPGFGSGMPPMGMGMGMGMGGMQGPGGFPGGMGRPPQMHMPWGAGRGGGPGPQQGYGGGPGPGMGGMPMGGGRPPQLPPGVMSGAGPPAGGGYGGAPAGTGASTAGSGPGASAPGGSRMQLPVSGNWQPDPAPAAGGAGGGGQLGADGSGGDGTGAGGGGRRSRWG